MEGIEFGTNNSYVAQKHRTKIKQIEKSTLNSGTEVNNLQSDPQSERPIFGKGQNDDKSHVIRG